MQNPGTNNSLSNFLSVLLLTIPYQKQGHQNPEIDINAQSESR
jgi:hypothetical protein